MFKICECTLRASARVQGAVIACRLESRADAAPSSGMLGIVVWMVRLAGSYTKSQMGSARLVGVVLLGMEASDSRSNTLRGDVETSRGRCNGPS